jgi:hypothetical protein
MVVVVSIVVSLASIGFIGLVAYDALQNAKIPDQEYATVTSKSAVSDKQFAEYVVTVSNGKTLYIQNNATLYNYLQINQTYLFDCRIDFNNQMLLIDRATQPPRSPV